MIAIAIACRPRLLIADEPTTALDVTVQAQILDLLRRLIAEHRMGLLLITHDLGVVADTCAVTNVMYGGRVVESAPTRELFRHPAHPYTVALMRSIPTRQVARKTRLDSIEGQPPVLRSRAGRLHVRPPVPARARSLPRRHATARSPRRRSTSPPAGIRCHDE